MNVIGKNILEDFESKHTDAKEQIDAWLCEAGEVQWNKPHDIKARYSSASFLKNNIVIFNIRGNNYRLAVKVNYKNQVVMIKKAGTHAEYSKWEF